MPLKFYSNFLELRVHLGHGPFHFTKVHGRADTRNDIFALRVDQIIAVENLFAGTGVASEADARAGGVSGVAEDHLHHIDGRAEQSRYFLHAAIGHSFLRHPRSEEHTSELQSHSDLVCRLLLEKKKKLAR